MGLRTNYPAPGGCHGLELSDVNGDGWLDAITASANSQVSVLMNSGDGAFETAINYPLSGPRCTAVQVGDLNGDGKPDIIALNDGLTAGSSPLDLLEVFINAGDGTFATPRLYPYRASYASLQMVDINRDGKLDVVAPGPYASFNVLLNLGDASFAPEQEYALGVAPYGVVAADLNNDGRLDIFAGTQASDVRVLLHQ